MDTLSKIILFTIAYVLCSISAYSQVMIDSVVVADSKPFTFYQHQPSYSKDDTTMEATKDFLQRINSGQLQWNTPGGLMTFLHRGMGNRHLPILWHGINLQSTINGSYDLGLIPYHLMDDMNFYTVGSPALTGNNGLAGALNIQDGIKVKSNATHIYSHFSTLQNYALGVKNTFNIHRWSSSLGIEIAKDQNIFDYTFNQKKLQRTNTEFDKINVVYSGNYFVSPRSVFSGNIWWQTSERVIPVSVTSVALSQKQKDTNLRSQLSHYFFGSKHKLHTSISYLKENLDFMTPAIDSQSEVDVFVSFLEWSELAKKSYLVGLVFRTDVATPNFYNDTKKRTTTQVKIAKNIQWATLFHTDISVRQDLVDEQLMPLSWTAHTIYKNTSLILASNYNFPGFNDLYWPTGGNPTLKTETSLQAELKTKLTLKKWRLNLASYGNLVNDWIQWVPQSNGIWTAANQKRVFSRGCEVDIVTDLYIGKVLLQPSFEYAFNNTTAIDHYFDPDLIGKQLIYIPVHKLGTHLSGGWRKHRVKLAYQWTGRRFDVSDQSQSLKPIHFLHLQYDVAVGNANINVQLQNLLNAKYEFVRFFPMPGLHADIKLSYKIF